MAGHGTIDVLRALTLLGEELAESGAEPVQLVACGGAGLIVCGLADRVTYDVDIVALMSTSGHLCSPDPLPPEVLEAARKVAAVLELSDDWLNNGPSRGEGGLFQLGLPDRLGTRLQARRFGPALTVHFVGRYDQICFKLYAACDQGPGRHFEDLCRLKPTAGELEGAAQWATTHDPSPGFRELVCGMLKEMGHDGLAKRICQGSAR